VPPPIRYGGLTIISGPSARQTGSLQRNSSFVSWEKLPDR